MTESEAIRVLKMVEAHGQVVREAKEMAIKALEKQIPKRPVERIGMEPIIRKQNGDTAYRVYYDCPACGEKYMERDKPCHRCGQMLEWLYFKKVEWKWSCEE